MSGIAQETHIFTARGVVRACELQENDLLFTKAGLGNAWGWAPLLSRGRRAVESTLALVTCQGTLKAAKGCLLLTKDGWVPIEQLEAGDNLRGMSCERIMVQDILPAGPSVVVDLKVGSVGTFLANDLIVKSSEE